MSSAARRYQLSRSPTLCCLLQAASEKWQRAENAAAGNDVWIISTQLHLQQYSRPAKAVPAVHLPDTGVTHPLA